MSYHGIASLVELPNQPGWDPRTGDQIVRRWRGSPAAVELQRLALRGAGIRYQVEQPEDGSYAIINGYYGAAETQDPGQAISDVWDLEGEDPEKAIWEHPRWIRLTQFADDDTRAEYVAKVRTWIENLARGERTWTDDDGTVIVLNQSEILENAAILFNLTVGQQEYLWLKWLIQDFVSGVEAWPTSRWVLRRTLTVSEGTTIRMDRRNVGNVSTTQELAAMNPIDPEILFDLPTTGWWVKRTPKKLNVGSGKYTIMYEWWHADDYSRFVYDRAL